MDMPDTVIVSVLCAENGVNIDMEIPTNMPVDNLQAKILDAFRSRYGGKFLNWKGCRIICDNVILNGCDTLADKGIFDGKYLNIINY